MADSAAPVGPEEAAHLFAPLLSFNRVLAAVSGGPDSMALLHLLAEWRNRLGKAAPSIAAATIDHQLRESSAAEAEFVAKAARNLEILHSIARWSGHKPARGIPAAARAARYRLLREMAEDSSSESVAVVTAHTLEDQAETFLLRLKRGAGVEGLAEMARLRAVEPDKDCSIMLVRPLLDIPKARLIATLRARGVEWVEDPSNTRLDQERPRMRALLRGLEQEGLTASAIARSARRLRRAEEAVSYAETHFSQQLRLRIDREIYAEFDMAAFHEGPRLLRERLLARLIQRFGGMTPPPRLSEIEDLAGRLDGGGSLRATLGGAVVSQGARAVRVWREAGRVMQAPLPLQGGRLQLWDGRFWVSASAIASDEAVCVRPLGADGVAALPADVRPKAAPARALWALPGFYQGGKLISVPTLAYHELGRPQCRAAPVHS